MARNWRDLFIVDGAPAPGGEDAGDRGGSERRMGRFRRLRENLRKTRQALTSEIQATLFEDLNDETWERLEEALIYADVGARTTAQVVEQLEREATGGEVTGGEALTQRLPAVEGMTEPLPETVPAPFMGIAHCCLRRDPQRRCTVADIAARLQSNSAASPQPSTVRIPASSAKLRYGLILALVILAAAALFFGPKLLNSHPDAQPTSSVSSQPPPSPAAQSAPPKPEPTVATVETKPSAVKQRDEHKISKAAALSPAPAPAPAVASKSTGGSSDQGKVLQQIEPVVSKSARNTVSGTIRIKVKVSVDASGNVDNATVITEGPSKYFARQAMEAAEQWKFAPAQANGQAVPSAWILHFGFRRSGTEVGSEPAKP